MLYCQFCVKSLFMKANIHSLICTGINLGFWTEDGNIFCWIPAHIRCWWLFHIRQTYLYDTTWLQQDTFDNTNDITTDNTMAKRKKDSSRQNTTLKAKDWAPQSSIKPEGELGCYGSLGSSCSNIGTSVYYVFFCVFFFKSNFFQIHKFHKLSYLFYR